MMSIFSDMVEDTLEVFMDDFSVIGESFESCLANMSMALQRCIEFNLVLNWEKCHFMVKEGNMVPKGRQGKEKASTSQKGQKRSRKDQEEGKEWYRNNKVKKYVHVDLMQKESLAKNCPRILEKIMALNLDFIFRDMGECNLDLTREFYANWSPRTTGNEVKIRGQVLQLNADFFNSFLGTPSMDPSPLKELYNRPFYRAIRHTLCGSRSMTQWTRHKDNGCYNTYPYACLNREARIWKEHIEEDPADHKLPHNPKKFTMMNGGRVLTDVELRQLYYDYPLNEHARAMCGVGVNFEEPLDEDVPIDDDHQLLDSDVEDNSNDEDSDDDSNAGGTNEEDFSTLGTCGQQRKTSHKRESSFWTKCDAWELFSGQTQSQGPGWTPQRLYSLVPIQVWSLQTTKDIIGTVNHMELSKSIRSADNPMQHLRNDLNAKNAELEAMQAENLQLRAQISSLQTAFESERSSNAEIVCKLIALIPSVSSSSI
ncbi:hypothetical protein FXO37_27975 [Capsicum annuum]|nr:hypothetical protein FXO37_27975 [Capsicum annuum]